MGAMWRIDKKTAIWGICFGILATLTGMLLLGAAEGGVYVESFFLMVLAWIVVPVMFALLLRRLSRSPREDDF